MTRVAPSASCMDLRRILSGLLPLLLVVAVLVFLLPQFADVSDVWAALRSMSSLQVGALLLAGGWNLLTYGALMVGTTPGLTLRQAMVVTESSTAVANTLPGGGALGIAVTATMLSSWGFSRARTTVSLLVSGLLNNLAKLVLPLVALACLALSGDVTTRRLLAAVAGVAGLLATGLLLWLLLRSEHSARRLGLRTASSANRLRAVVGRAPVSGWELATTKFRARTVLLLRERWALLSVLTLVSHLSLYLVLLLSLRCVGVGQSEVGWAEVLAVFAFTRLLTAVPITPGGAGVVEVALAAGLTAAGGDGAEVVAGVLAFRTLTWVVPIPLGVLTYLFWRSNTSWRRAPGTAPRTTLVPETS